MYSSIMLSLAVALGMPGEKDPPKKGAEIAGEWVEQTFIFGGKDATSAKGDKLRFVFSADGKVSIAAGKKKPDVGTYKLDVKKVPAQIDMDPPADLKDPTFRGIFKIEGDTLTLCLVDGKKAARPTKFESPKDSMTMLMTFKRVSK